ncbi:MAG: winged helix-turn-helix transcriptional regulator [Methanoregula sp.]|jgi:predicted transcriptional regulator|nr:winged helix-turn-helix transcriptional regulator [Methanoregula sp.]
MKPSLIFLFFLLIVAFNVTIVHGGYSVDSFPLQNGPSDTLGTDGLTSFFALPLWIQLIWISSLLLAIFGAIKFGPFIFGKVRVKLQNMNRAVILDYIENNPGCTLSDLSKNTGVNRGTAKYHLFLLLIAQKVVRKKYGKFTYLFSNGGKHLEKKQVYGYIMNPAKRKILEMILDKPGISNKEIAAGLEYDPSTTHWHLQQFLNEKMIVSQWDGRNTNYFLVPDVEEIIRCRVPEFLS